MPKHGETHIVTVERDTEVTIEVRCVDGDWYDESHVPGLHTGTRRPAP